MFGSNAFNAALPVYTNVSKMPKYLSDVKLDVSTENFYWGSRLIGVMADAHFGACVQLIERYQAGVMTRGSQIIHETDEECIESGDFSGLEKANQKLADMAKAATIDTLTKLTLECSKQMKNGYQRADN